MFSRHSLPVLVYHHVNNLGEDITQDQFYAQMELLAARGYRTIFLKDWVAGKVIPDGKTVALTFDDGNLDNWVYAYPILKRLGLKATIFVVTVRPYMGSELRYNLDDVWSGKITEGELPKINGDWEAHRNCVLRDEGTSDFLGWREMKVMEDSGVIDIQSHSHYHRDFFVSSRIVDFNQNKYFGVGWATDGDIRYGIPIYPRKSGLTARRYFDDLNLRDYVAERVDGPQYFLDKSKKEYMRQLLGIVSEYKRKHPIKGIWETEEERNERILVELGLAKKIIEERLGKICDLICWPWGEYSALSILLAKEAGYRGAVAFSPGRNLHETEARIWEIKRFPPPRDIDGFEKAITAYSSPSASLLLEWRNYIREKGKKLAQRLRERTFFRSVKGKITDLRSR